MKSDVEWEDAGSDTSQGNPAMAVIATNEIAAAKVIPSAGWLLRRTRELQGWRRHDIAMALDIPEHSIASVEIGRDSLAGVFDKYAALLSDRCGTAWTEAVEAALLREVTRRIAAEALPARRLAMAERTLNAINPSRRSKRLAKPTSLSLQQMAREDAAAATVVPRRRSSVGRATVPSKGGEGGSFIVQITDLMKRRGQLTGLQRVAGAVS